MIRGISPPVTVVEGSAQAGDQAERQRGEVVGDLVLGDLVGAQPDDRQHPEEAEPESGADRVETSTIETARTPTLTPRKATTRSRRWWRGKYTPKVRRAIAARSAAAMISFVQRSRPLVLGGGPVHPAIRCLCAACAASCGPGCP